LASFGTQTSETVVESCTVERKISRNIEYISIFIRIKCSHNTTQIQSKHTRTNYQTTK